MSDLSEWAAIVGESRKEIQKNQKRAQEMVERVEKEIGVLESSFIAELLEHLDEKSKIYNLCFGGGMTEAGAVIYEERLRIILKFLNKLSENK